MGSKEVSSFSFWLSNHDFWIPHPQKHAWMHLQPKRIIFSFTNPDFLKRPGSTIEGRDAEISCFWTNLLPEKMVFPYSSKAEIADLSHSAKLHPEDDLKTSPNVLTSSGRPHMVLYVMPRDASAAGRTWDVLSTSI